MKICGICLNNDMLCQACNNKLERGEISELDVKLSRALHKLGIRGDFIKAIDGNYVVIFCDSSSASKLIGRSGRNAKKIEGAIGKRVRVIENSGKKAVAEKVLNVPVIGINILYSGGESYKIRIQKQYQRKVKQEAASMLDKIFDKNVQLVFE